LKDTSQRAQRRGWPAVVESRSWDITDIFDDTEKEQLLGYECRAFFVQTGEVLVKCVKAFKAGITSEAAATSTGGTVLLARWADVVPLNTGHCHKQIVGSYCKPQSAYTKL
jgi:hypothetical protein